MASSHYWLHFFPEFTNSFRVIAPDMRGHGLSTYKTPLKSIDDMANDLKMFVEALGLTGLYVLGWSMGGGVAMKFAANNPDRVERLMLVNSLGPKGLPIWKMDAQGNPTQERVKTEEEALNHPDLKKIASIYEKKDYKGMRDFLETKVFTGTGKPEPPRLDMLIDDCLKCKYGSRLFHFTNIYNISNENNGVTEGTNEISKIQTKTLILHGEKNSFTKISGSQYIKGQLKDMAELKVFSDAGNVLMEDYYDEFMTHVKSFFSTSGQQQQDSVWK
jgi:pimeloyl-ACP methyl ester carboxylesterase